MFSTVTLRTIAQWCKGEVFNGFDCDKVATVISTDSRTLKPGQVFLALRGESFDGNQFIKHAEKVGALGVIGEVLPTISIPYLKVSNGLMALIEIGKRQRNFFKNPVIAITGSAGKSSTKEMIATLLGPETVASPASFNNLIGVSKTLCLLDSETRHLILEMGMNAEGEIAQLCQNFRPEIGIITNIGDANLGKLGGREGVFRAKKELFDYLSSDSATCNGIALNQDDPLVVRAYDETFGARKVRRLSYSLKNESCDVLVKKSKMDPDTAFLDIELLVEGRGIQSTIPIFGLHHTQNLAAAIAGARLRDLDLNTIFERLPNLKPAAHRGEIHLLSENRILIDESYNSNPTALRSSLASVMQMNPKRRLVLVLGEMRELGEFSLKEHANVGKILRAWLSQRPSDSVIYGIGAGAKPMVEELRAEKRISAHFFLTVEETFEPIEKVSKSGDILLIKGSRAVKLDLLVNRIASS